MRLWPTAALPCTWRRLQVGPNSSPHSSRQVGGQQEERGGEGRRREALHPDGSAAWVFFHPEPRNLGTSWIPAVTRGGGQGSPPAPLICGWAIGRSSAFTRRLPGCEPGGGPEWWRAGQWGVEAGWGRPVFFYVYTYDLLLTPRRLTNRSDLVLPPLSFSLPRVRAACQPAGPGRRHAATFSLRERGPGLCGTAGGPRGAAAPLPLLPLPPLPLLPLPPLPPLYSLCPCPLCPF